VWNDALEASTGRVRTRRPAQHHPERVIAVGGGGGLPADPAAERYRSVRNGQAEAGRKRGMT
jgi:hypothetical protein